MKKRRRAVVPGAIFGRLTVVGRLTFGKRSRWECMCECGSTVEVIADSLCSGHTKSCGCLKLEKATIHGCASNGNTSAEYGVWCAMKSRCNRTTNGKYRLYGGRGITVCERWQDSFLSFLEDMGPRPSKGFTIERINNDLGYCPENCRWATYAEQSRNQCRTRILELNGVDMCAEDWARRFGMPSASFHKWLGWGLSMEWIAANV